MISICFLLVDCEFCCVVSMFCVVFLIFICFVLCCFWVGFFCLMSVYGVVCLVCM